MTIAVAVPPGGEEQQRFGPMPRSLFAYAWQVSGRRQLWLALLAAVIFLLTMGPLELQRRIVNSALASSSIGEVAWLCGAYAVLVIGAGAIKLGFNVYRARVSEGAVRDLRRRVYGHGVEFAEEGDLEQEGVGMSVILAEVEPVGGFVGVSFSEPLMQIGILVTVFGYMVALQPWMAVFSMMLFSVQALFIPRIQRMINRRASERITVLREMSDAMLDDLGPGPTPAARRREFLGRVDRVFGLNMEISWRKFTMNFLMNLTHHFGIIGVLFVGGWFIIQGQIEAGTVVVFISGLKQINDPWGDLVNYMREMTVSQVKYRLIADLLDARVGTDDRRREDAA